MVPMQGVAKVAAGGAETESVLLPRYLNRRFNIICLDIDFLRVCFRLRSCAMLAQGKETNEERHLHAIFFCYQFICFYRYYLSSISSMY